MTSGTLPWSPGAAGPLLEILAEVRGLSWMDRASCAEVGGDEWFPEKNGSVIAAKKVCGDCEVRAECLAYALDHTEYGDVGSWGVWGGASERERDKMLRERGPRKPTRRRCGHLRTPETTFTDSRGHVRCQECADAAKMRRSAA